MMFPQLNTYLAASYKRREQLDVFANRMTVDCRLAATWVRRAPDDLKLENTHLTAWAMLDADEVARADCVVRWQDSRGCQQCKGTGRVDLVGGQQLCDFCQNGVIHDFVRGGNLVEQGIAIASNVPVCVVGPIRTVFDHHPLVTLVADDEGAFSWLREQVRKRKLLLSSLGI